MSFAQSLPLAPAPAAPPAGPARAPLDPDERFARLRLARSLNVGPRTFAQLLRRFGTARRALEALPNLAARGGRSNYEAADASSVRAEIDAGQAAGATLLVAGESDFPPFLGQIEPVPPVLWVLGDPAIFLRPAVAVVGARNASSLGMRTSRRLARELGSMGYVVVSGLARGIDCAAHEVALTSGTIAVCAGGLDHVYPPEHSELAEQIAETGALVSEVPFGVAPTARHFPRRNRLISGLAQGVVLVEAAARSGSLITARFALEQGREAMACPGAAEDPRSAGCNALIREGAALIRHAGDVAEAMAAPRTLALAEDGGEFDFDADMFSEDTLRDDYEALADFDEEGGTGDEALADQIIQLLGPHPIEIDEVARQCGTDPADLSLAILELDLAGRIEIMPGGMIALCLDED